MSPALDGLAPDGLHRRLRAATAPVHARLEHDLDWRARVSTRDGYRALLARFHGFHAAYEAAIALALADAPFFEPRRRLDALTADLSDLGLSVAGIAALPRPDPIGLAGTGAATGALYVLEGSTLGGQVIGRHVAGTLGPGTPCRYYSAHGPRTGAMWSAFRARLDGLPEADGPPAIAAATATFDALRDWLCTADDARAGSRLTASSGPGRG